jgi:hypothetical protein
VNADAARRRHRETTSGRRPPEDTSGLRRSRIARLLDPTPDWRLRISVELELAEAELSPAAFQRLLDDVEALVQRRRRRPRRRVRSW